MKGVLKVSCLIIRSRFPWKGCWKLHQGGIRWDGDLVSHERKGCWKCCIL